MHIGNCADGRLTDPVLRETYLNFGHPDGAKFQEPIFGIALPKKIIQQWRGVFTSTYLAVISGVVPGLAALWWIRSQSKTVYGFHGATAYRFFSAAMGEKALDFAQIIIVLSSATEVTSEVKSVITSRNLSEVERSFFLESFPIFLEGHGQDLQQHTLVWLPACNSTKKLIAVGTSGC